MHLEVMYGAAARRALLAGVDAVGDAVAVTLGPKGRYVVLDRRTDPQSTEPDGLTITNDGVTVAQELELEGPFENQGARLIREVARATEQDAGDGTTTAIVLAQAMIRDGLRVVAAGADPAAVQRGIAVATQQASDHLGGVQALAVAGRRQTRWVAAVAAGDEEIGALVADAFEAVGETGVVTVNRDSARDRIDLELTAGMWFYNGYLSPHMVTERGEAVLDEPYILIANQELVTAEPLVGVLELVAPTGRPLLVIADRVEGPALGLLVANHLQGSVRCAAVKARHIGDHRRGHLDEVALYTGGQSIAAGTAVAVAELSQLGRARRVVITRDATTIIDGAGDAEQVAARIRGLRREIGEAATYDRERLQERLGQLAGVIARFRVGGPTEAEISERGPRVTDAVESTRAALRHGIVPGGGVALLAAQAAIDASGLSADEAIGAEVVRRALEEPARRIAENAGFSGSVAVARARGGPAGQGLDVRDGEYRQMIEAGILDPALVPRVALHNAASVARIALGVEAVVVGTEGEPAGASPAIDRPPKRLLHGMGARLALWEGIDAAARAVTVTLGPGGRHVVLARDAGDRVVITSDGAAVLREISLADPFQARGARLLQQLAGASGGGTTTATVLAHSIVRAGHRSLAAGADPVALRRGIEAAVVQAVEHLRDVQSTEAGNLAHVATVAAGDEAIGAVVAEAFERVGRDGVVTVEAGRTLGLELDVASGMRWSNGLLSPDQATDPERRAAALEDPFVLCVDERIASATELAAILDEVAETGRPLLIVARAVEPEPLAMLVANQARGRLTAVAVTAPDFLEQRRRNLEDVAILTGGEAITEELGRSLARARISQLGSARRVVVTQSETTILGGAGDDVGARIETIRGELSAGGLAPLERDRLRERLARLAGGVAWIRVGGATETEIGERRVRAEDAVRAVEAAFREGVVAGGGVALLRAREAIDSTRLDPDEAAGAELVRQALEQPLRRIAQNAGLDGGVVAERVGRLGLREGLDAATGEYRDLVAAGIVDPTMAVRSALENAASVAKTVLLAECVVVEAPGATSG